MAREVQSLGSSCSTSATVRESEKALAPNSPRTNDESGKRSGQNVAKQVERDPDARITPSPGRFLSVGGSGRRPPSVIPRHSKLEATDNSDLWFRVCRVSAPRGDRDGYRRGCYPCWRPRTCELTLALRLHAGPRFNRQPERALDPRLSMSELISSRDEYWGAHGNGCFASPGEPDHGGYSPTRRSLLADDRPGRAVLNWLWLALAYQSSNKDEAGERWLDKAGRK